MEPTDRAPPSQQLNVPAMWAGSWHGAGVTSAGDLCALAPFPLSKATNLMLGSPSSFSELFCASQRLLLTQAQVNPALETASITWMQPIQSGP